MNSVNFYLTDTVYWFKQIVEIFMLKVKFKW